MKKYPPLSVRAVALISFAGSLSFVSGAVINSNFGFVSSSPVTTDSTLIPDSPSPTTFTISSSSMFFQAAGGGNTYAFYGGTSGGLSSTVTFSFDKPISSFSLTVADYDNVGQDATPEEFLNNFSIFPTSISGQLQDVGGGRIDPSVNNATGVLTWDSLPGGTTSISYTHNRDGNGLNVFLDSIVATTVPEPSVGALVAILGLSSIFRRRR